MATRNNRPLWELMKEYINKHIETGHKFTRKNMLSYIYPETAKEMRKIETTPDHYRSLLSKIEILAFTGKAGVYIKLRNIPNGLTTSKLQKISRDSSWKRWFIPIEDKI